MPVHSVRDIASRNSLEHSMLNRLTGLGVVLKYSFLAQSVILFILYMIFALPIYSNSSRVLGWLVVQVAAVMWLFWRKDDPPPVLQMIISLYAVYFSLPLFYMDVVYKLRTAFFLHEPLSRDVLGMVLLVQVSLVAGWLLANRTSYRLRMRIDAPVSRLQVLAYAIILIQLGLQYIRITSDSIDLGFGLRVFNGIFNYYLALGILYYVSCSRGWSALRTFGVLLIFVSGIVESVNSTMLGELIIPFLVLGMLTLGRNMKRTLILGAFLMLAFIVIQPVKLEYRSKLLQMEHAGIHLSFSEKADLYGVLAVSYWGGKRIETYYDESPSVQAGKRFALLPLMEIILDETPERIPFQYGKTMLFLAYLPVPRFIYPDKPTAQEANVWMAQAYGILDSDLAKNTMVGVSHLGEVYINFGAFGIIPIFLLVGFSLSRLTKLLAGPNATLARKSVYVSILPQFLSVESTLTMLISGLIYSVLLSIIAVRVAGMRMPRSWE
jgi:hypothetical protein